MHSELLEAMREPLNGFLRNALLAGLLASVSFGVVGTYVVTKRITYIAGAIAHCALGGIGFALYAKHELGWAWFDPMHGALIVALASALLIGGVVLSRSEREDTVIGATWAAGMAIGVIFVKKVPRSGVSLESWLFGNINFASKTDLWTIALLGTAVLVLVLLFHKELVAVCFDEDFARARGVNVPLFYLLLLCMTAVTVVLLVRIVGIIMVIALLTLPAALGSRFSRGLPGMMLWAVGLCALLLTAGLECSLRWNTPAGATVIIVAAAAYFAVLFTAKLLPRRASKGS